MVQILPFAGWRYDLSQVGALSEVIAPANCLIDESLQHTLYRQHPCNAVRLVLNREEPGDTSVSDRAARADDFWRLWKRERILLREHNAAFYILETTFQSANQERTRWSVVAKAQLTDPVSADDRIRIVGSYAAEHVALRRELRSTCHASFTPVVALIAEDADSDPDGDSLSDYLERIVRQVPPLECTADEGIRHRLWPLTDPTVCFELQHRLANFSVFIIDGAEEYQAALESAPEDRGDGPNDVARSVLFTLIPSADPGVEFDPYIMVIPTKGALSIDEVQSRLSVFQCQFVGTELTAGDDAVELAQLSSDQPCIALGTSDGSWMIVSGADSEESGGSKRSPESLVKQITAVIDDSVPRVAPAINRSFGTTSVSKQAVELFATTPESLLLIVPPRSSADILLAGRTSSILPRGAVSLQPSVPTGLVFLSVETD